MNLPIKILVLAILGLIVLVVLSLLAFGIGDQSGNAINDFFGKLKELFSFQGFGN